ncbi:unnamed protein product [Rotaria sordida]|uniref:Uncharacterized protein n=1 Tax=Rotaria sordida TaxID=392033 RepID=A0A815B0U2_9BILA|nr:unnamed protein product [Rotaria sordida]CAF1543637.1 unnamed protein product [Rotaria sordida]
MTQQNFNVEIFNKFGFESTSKGNIICPRQDCEIEFQLLDGQQSLTDDQKKEIWNHVQDDHPTLFKQLFEKYSTKATFTPREQKIDSAIEIVGATYVKINQILSKISITGLNEQQILQLISQENAKMEQKLADVLMDVSTPSQQQRTSSSLASHVATFLTTASQLHVEPILRRSRA